MKKILETAEVKFNTEPQPAPEIPVYTIPSKNEEGFSTKPARKTRMYEDETGVKFPIVEIHSKEGRRWNYRHKKTTAEPSEYILATFLSLHFETEAQKTEFLTRNRENTDDYNNYSDIYQTMKRNAHFYDCFHRTENLLQRKRWASKCTKITIRDVEEKNWIKKLTNSDNYIGQHQENCRKICDRLKKLEPDINYRILVSNRHLNGASTNLNCQETWENGGMPGDFSGGRFKNVPNLAPEFQGLFCKYKMKEEERLRSQSTKFIVGKGQLGGLL